MHPLKKFGHRSGRYLLTQTSKKTSGPIHDDIISVPPPQINKKTHEEEGREGWSGIHDVYASKIFTEEIFFPYPEILLRTSNWVNLFYIYVNFQPMHLNFGISADKND